MKKAYSYDFSFDSTIINRYKRGFIYERLAEINIDKMDREPKKNYL